MYAEQQNPWILDAEDIAPWGRIPDQHRIEGLRPLIKELPHLLAFGYDEVLYMIAYIHQYITILEESQVDAPEGFQTSQSFLERR